MKGQYRIDSLFAFVVIDEDGTEGVPAVPGPGGMQLPMVGADLAMVEMFKPLARRWAQENGRAVTLVHFSRRTVQEVYEPDGSISRNPTDVEGNQ